MQRGPGRSRPDRSRSRRQGSGLPDPRWRRPGGQGGSRPGSGRRGRRSPPSSCRARRPSRGVGDCCSGRRRMSWPRSSGSSPWPSTSQREYVMGFTPKGRVMSRVLTTTTYGVLGLLAVRPYSTYSWQRRWGSASAGCGRAPRASCSKSPRSSWSTATPGRARRRQAAPADRAARSPAAGRRALAAWLAEPGDGPVLEFDGLVKLMFADHGSRADALETISGQGLGSRDER